jgi:hypothetical protein
VGSDSDCAGVGIGMIGSDSDCLEDDADGAGVVAGCGAEA